MNTTIRLKQENARDWFHEMRNDAKLKKKMAILELEVFLLLFPVVNGK